MSLVLLKKEIRSIREGEGLISSATQDERKISQFFATAGSRESNWSLPDVAVEAPAIRGNSYPMVAVIPGDATFL